MVWLAANSKKDGIEDMVVKFMFESWFFSTSDTLLFTINHEDSYGRIEEFHKKSYMSRDAPVFGIKLNYCEIQVWGCLDGPNNPVS